MSLYRIDLHDTGGETLESRTRWFDRDDHAIDHAGSLNHPHSLTVWDGERLVARFPPLKGRGSSN